jgi:predicted amidohydrolase YtcJ
LPIYSWHDRKTFSGINIDDYFWKLNLPYLGGERAFNQQYPLNSLFEAGANVTVASDFWVTEPDPMTAIYCGVTRRMPQTVFDREYGEDPGYRWVPDSDAVLEPGDLGVLPPLEERADLTDMIVASTYNGAYANFLDGDIGSIEVGKLADLVVLDQNLFDIDLEQIPETRIVMTFFEGRQVYPAIDNYWCKTAVLDDQKILSASISAASIMRSNSPRASSGNGCG